ncbi:MAG TPA: hypothetical protein VGN88_05060 [Phycisphaerae bacterium]|jgi:hypothetical protein
MTKKRITYGDISQLLDAEGFRPTGEKEANVRFNHATTRAAIILPKQKPSEKATGMDLDLLRHTMVNFGVMSAAEFDRWVADPKHYQAA